MIRLVTVGWIELTSDIVVIDYERKRYLDAAYLNVGLYPKPRP